MRDFGRFALHFPSVACAVLGILLNFAGLATPSWQVTYARELQQWIQNGLWMSCHTRPSGMHTCTYSFTERNYNPHFNPDFVDIQTPPFYPWQNRLFWLIVAGQLVAISGLFCFCVSTSPPLRLKFALVYSVALVLATVAFVVAIGVFAVFSSMVEYRFYQVSVSGIYDKQHGYSFYLFVVGTILVAIALALSIAFIVYDWRTNDGFSRPDSGYLPNRDTEFVRMDPYEREFAMRQLPDIPQKDYRW
uniref:Claudin n=1 Tax=Steinernema glaseri TaxID=37863 RepID=A0A1I7Z0L4_9BILA